MEQVYGIFMKIGTPQNYGQLNGSGLVKMNLLDFAAEEEAIEFINNTAAIPSNVEYYIIAFTRYRKPTPLA